MRRITVVGAGALGSHLVPLLRNLECCVRVIDFDRVEKKNTLSQIYGKTSIGKNKANALGQIVDFLYGMKIETFPHKLTEDNSKQLLNPTEHGSIIVDCTDNAEAREIIRRQWAFFSCLDSRRPKIDLLHGALAANGQYGRVVWTENFVIDSEAGQGQATCEDGGALPFIAQTSALLARSIQIYLTTGTKRGYEINPAGVFSS